MQISNPQETENAGILKRFIVLTESNRLAHAYFFIGPEGVGKTQAALEVAKLINCEGQARTVKGAYCDACPSCVKINSGNHPDVSVIDTGDNQTIKIEKIRELITKSQMSPFEAKRKIFIIKDSEHLTLEGSNALLKTLEEPSPSSLLLLTTSVPEKNLETVRSRCHPVYFFPLSQKRLAQRLTQDANADPKTAQFLAGFCEGCGGRAMHLQDEKFFQRKNSVLDHFLFEERNNDFLKEILTDRQETKQVLDILLYWFRDLLLLKQGVAPERMIHVDRIEELRAMEPRFTSSELEDCLSEVISACRLWGDNLNVKIPLALIKEEIWGKSSKFN